jgi:hypothetical protein
MSADFSVRYAGSITLLCPLTAEARAWIAQCIPNGCIVLDTRQIEEIVAAIKSDGLQVVERNEFTGARQH